jgi:hypothetical protein
MAWTISGDYYVDARSGDDGNPGTSAEPFKTIPAAIAAAEAGGSGYQDIVVGAGTYTDRLVAGTTTDYLCFKADGEVIFDASNTGDSAFYNGKLWRVEGFKIIDVEEALQKSSNDANRVNFSRCYIKNCPDWFIDLAMLEISTYHDTNCIFENVGNTNLSTSHYARYWAFSNCMFIDSWMPGYRQVGTAFSGNSYPAQTTSCVFVNTSDNQIVNFYQTHNTFGFVRNCFFNEHAIYKDSGATRYSGSGLIEYFETNPDSRAAIAGASAGSASFNNDISGSNMISDASFTMPGLAANRDFFHNYRLGAKGRFAGTNNMATAYGYESASSNAFHPMGGATWTNITASDAGGLQISASAHPTGTIESAVIDQGSVKVIREVKTSFTSTVLGATGIAAISSSAENQFPSRETFEMRYGNTSNLSSNTYKIFDTALPTYVDINGSGSGDIAFNTSSLSFPTARYLQLKFTLRTNMTGST